MKEKSYLGIFGPGPNSSAALVSRNEIIAWVEEERFNRIKLAPNTYPINAINFCIQKALSKGFKIEGINEHKTT